MFTASYKMRNPSIYDNAYVPGTVYYFFDDTTLTKSRIRFCTNYELIDEDSGKVTKVKYEELYHYEKKAIYSFCDLCTSVTMDTPAEAWWKVGSDKDCVSSGSYRRCTRQTNHAYGVIEFMAKGKPGDQGFDIKFVTFADGRNMTLEGFSVSNYDTHKNKLEVSESDKCREPMCRSYMDVVFVLDSSSSIMRGQDGWTASVNFVRDAVSHFTPGYDGGAMFGIVTFSAPDATCKCYGKDCYYNLCCYDSRVRKVEHPLLKPGEHRFLDDCLFDEFCDPEHDTSAEILLNLTDDVQGHLGDLHYMNGHTCQRYGLIKAFNMLYGAENTRRQTALASHTKPPVPVVIVVTDGWDLCRNSTEEWANRIKDEDENAILLEIGVGLKHAFDEQYISNLSSKLGDQSASLNVDNYGDLWRVIETMKMSVCDNVPPAPACSTNCKGFCACQKCVCPICSDDNAGSCKYFKCNSAENGCKERPVFCKENELTKTGCYENSCDAATSQCRTEPIDCMQVLKDRNKNKKYYNCQVAPCTFNMGGCHEEDVFENHTFCQEKAGLCKVGRCEPNSYAKDEDGCVITDRDCSQEETLKGCTGLHCINGQCIADSCLGPCYEEKEDHTWAYRCEKRPCQNTTCIVEGDVFKECLYEDVVCEDSEPNKCRQVVCDKELNDCVSVPIEGGGGCPEMNTFCTYYQCIASANEGRGGCVAFNVTHEEDNCYEYVCSDEKEQWIAVPRCSTDLACKIARCNYEDGSCYEEDLNCFDKVNITDRCFQAACREPTGCYKRQYRGAYFDVCGNCIKSDSYDGSSVEEEAATDCVTAPDEELKTEGLAAAAIALIIVGAIIIGAAIMFSGIMGTKALIDRARGAANQSVVSNPLFEDSQTEMSNPGFLGETI